MLPLLRATRKGHEHLYRRWIHSTSSLGNSSSSTPHSTRTTTRKTTTADPVIDDSIMSKSQNPTLQRRRSIGRGGQNLSERYKRLERSRRGKKARTREVVELESSALGVQAAPLTATTATTTTPSESPGTAGAPGVVGSTSSAASTSTVTATSTSTGSATSKPGVETFKGLVIPRKPEPPADDECCMSGCAICVYDLYDESLEAYEESIDKIRARLTDMGVAMEEWPASIRPGASSSSSQASDSPQAARGAVYSAFEELERNLKAKQAAAAESAASAEAKSDYPSSPSPLPPQPQPASTQPKVTSATS
ncbi:hypothetical protein CC1G_05217 [Coprinopsis cinerea okayama7|uniref:Oxidoreductase-like domain-containing protein n=1 Tax=Coprinopsis cinerea (strain Okayama-7 / 130 / ATCC MYA-4618 / FGSC 9003) TaxID=240176 RepID=A8PC73_COPC7|nr:hypothetical protein CC1G_05217 [Coprinopsis cinerea okayama7\|eukprot:XP_001840331.2 hypothetical protein CC1G_05217 [Coprinopsis cinerea okayama7\